MPITFLLIQVFIDNVVFSLSRKSIGLRTSWCVKTSCAHKSFPCPQFEPAEIVFYVHSVISVSSWNVGLLSTPVSCMVSQSYYLQFLWKLSLLSDRVLVFLAMCACIFLRVCVIRTDRWYIIIQSVSFRLLFATTERALSRGRLFIISYFKEV